MKLFVESHTILANRSGVGWFAHGLVKGLQARVGVGDEIRLLTHPRENTDIDDLLDHPQTFNEPIDWLPPQIYHALKFRNKVPPVDLVYGKGVYIFPNFIRWPLAGAPSVIVVHDLSMFVCPQFLHPENLKFMTRHLGRSVEHADLIVAVSQTSKQTVCEHFKVDPDKVVVSHLAADSSLYYHRSDEEIAEVKAKYGIFGDYLMFLSTLEPRKNVEGLVRAYQALPKKLKDEVSLVLIGGRGWQDEGIRQAIREARIAGDRIIQPGYVATEDLPAFYSGARGFVFPSLYEGFGLPVLEALSCGTPVLTGDNSSLPEAAGKAALYIDVASHEQLVEGMKQLITNEPLRQKLITEGYKQAAKFSWPKCADVILDGIQKRHLA